MYKAYFGLTRSPFEVSPDPFFLLPTEAYNEALGCVYYGICKRKGFVVVTGEVGTGKTLLVRWLLEMLTLHQVAFANVFNPMLSADEFLRYVLRDLGLKPQNQSKGDLLHELNQFLIARYRKGLSTVLIVDEAQHLSPEVLEEIRLLTNLETSQQKLLQILLVGQPELDRRLDAIELRQLKQRIVLRCRLEPLPEEETQQYIYGRLRRAGMTIAAESLFPADAVALIHQYSNGIPRLINVICENALIAVFANQQQSVSCQLIEDICAEYRLQPRPSRNGNGLANAPQQTMNALSDLLNSLKRLDRAVAKPNPTIPAAS